MAFQLWHKFVPQNTRRSVDTPRTRLATSRGFGDLKRRNISQGGLFESLLPLEFPCLFSGHMYWSLPEEPKWIHALICISLPVPQQPRYEWTFRSHLRYIAIYDAPRRDAHSECTFGGADGLKSESESERYFNSDEIFHILPIFLVFKFWTTGSRCPGSLAR